MDDLAALLAEVNELLINLNTLLETLGKTGA